MRVEDHFSSIILVFRGQVIRLSDRLSDQHCYHEVFHTHNQISYMKMNYYNSNKMAEISSATLSLFGVKLTPLLLILLRQK